MTDHIIHIQFTIFQLPRVAIHPSPQAGAQVGQDRRLCHYRNNQLSMVVILIIE